MNGCGVCNQFSRCISGCRYYSKEGRIDLERGGKKMLSNQRDRHVRINLSIPFKELEFVDRAAKWAKINRSVWLRQAIDQAISGGCVTSLLRFSFCR
jgi:hypothetical protein